MEDKLMQQEEDVRFFKDREKVYQSSVKGKFRNLRWAVMAVLLGIYYLTPFLRWDRGADLPNQAVLIDMPGRRAYFFMIEIWPQEVHYLLGLLILAAVGLFFVTSLFGRVWCGYACFQTVWTDLFLVVERFFQGGDHFKQKALDKGPWTFNKIWRKAATHITWIIISFLTGGAWVLYFNDAPTFVDGMLHGYVPTVPLMWMLALTFTTYLMAGIAREQVCIYMCPYARFQSAMFDKDTLIIGYDEKRGEPRGKHKKGESWEGHGHCIDCDRCVHVCPTGIDIRKGLQLQCIACGLCIDACDEVMKKLDLPRGLIDYNTSHNLANPEQYSKFEILRPRTFYYAFIIIIVCSAMLYSILTRAPMELNVIHDRNPLIVKTSNGDIRNGYTVKILNKTHNSQRYQLKVEGMDKKAKIAVKGNGDVAIKEVVVATDDIGIFRVYITSPELKEHRLPIKFVLNDILSGETVEHKSVFMSGK